MVATTSVSTVRLVLKAYLHGGTDSSVTSLDEGETIARVKSNNGGNSFSAELPDGSVVLAKLPSKFHKVIWVKPGDLVILDGIETCEIVNILSKETVKELSRLNKLPDAFQLQGRGEKKNSGYDMEDIMPSMEDEEEEEEEEQEVEV
eukprot:scaffold860_cov155-Ochromonas_danica.AAC.7